MNISVAPLPGIGQKITFITAEESMLVLVVHHNGKRELYFFEDAENDEADFAMDLTADETRELGAQLLGATYQPVEADKIKLFKNQMIMDWIKLKDSSPLVNKSLEESDIRQKTGATVMGIVRGDDIIAAPEPSTVLLAGDLIMTMGKKDQVSLVEAFCKGEE